MFSQYEFTCFPFLWYFPIYIYLLVESESDTYPTREWLERYTQQENIFTQRTNHPTSPLPVWKIILQWENQEKGNSKCIIYDYHNL